MPPFLDVVDTLTPKDVSYMYEFELCLSKNCNCAYYDMYKQLTYPLSKKYSPHNNDNSIPIINNKLSSQS